MSEKNEKKENEEVSARNLSDDEKKSTITQEQKADAGKPQNTISSFVIKKSPKKKAVDILHEADIEKLIEKYPVIGSVKGIKKIKTPVLFFTEDAEMGIKKHIAWGKNTDDNIHEQGGLLIGKPFQVGGSIVGVAEHIIPADVVCANFAYLKMGTETWVKMLDIYDECYKEKGMYIIGWFHTHPNNLPVFMSSTDMGTQHAFFDQDWHFSVVLNPHRHLIACFNSANADKCDYYPSDFTCRQEGDHGK